MNPNLLLAALAGLWIASAPAVDWTAAQWSLPKGATRDGNVLTVTLEQTGTAMATVPVDLSPYAGKCIAAKIRVSAVDLQRGSQAWLGYKFMLSYKDAKTGGREWPGAPCLTGTFDWKESSFTCDLRGKDPADARLSLGLQDTRGSVSFDLASLVIEETKPLFDLDLSDRKCAYTPELKARPVKRGVMLPSGRCTEDGFKTLRGWGATLARYQMVRDWGKIEDNRDIAEYAAWVDSKLDHLVNDVLPWAEKYGVDIVVDLHVAPGGLEKSHEMAMFHDERYADAFVEIWKRIATRCKGRPRVWGYDLINEPVQRTRAIEGSDYLGLQVRAAKAVREIDPVTPIVIESNESDGPGAYQYLQALDLTDVIYQVHMYHPGAFTHQGVNVSKNSDWHPTVYPDPSKGWTKEFLRKELEPVRRFQLRHGARIYVGEFSAIAWAEGADRYLADCISIFNEYGWDWTYHAFREWDGWSVEHEARGWKKMAPSADNPRKRALLDGFNSED